MLLGVDYTGVVSTSNQMLVRAQAKNLLPSVDLLMSPGFIDVALSSKVTSTV